MPSENGDWNVKYSREAAVMGEVPKDIEKIYLHVTGMTCASCVNSIERGLMKKRGRLVLLEFSCMYFRPVAALAPSPLILPHSPPAPMPPGGGRRGICFLGKSWSPHFLNDPCTLWMSQTYGWWWRKICVKELMIDSPIITPIKTVTYLGSLQCSLNLREKLWMQDNFSIFYMMGCS